LLFKVQKSPFVLQMIEFFEYYKLHQIDKFIFYDLRMNLLEKNLLENVYGGKSIFSGQKLLSLSSSSNLKMENNFKEDENSLIEIISWKTFPSEHWKRWNRDSAPREYGELLAQWDCIYRNYILIIYLKL